jgi:hypothetical protein
VNIVPQRTVLAARQGSQDCIKHTFKILRNCCSKESQHNSGSSLVQAPESVGSVESGAEDQWEVTRAAALDGLFAVSQVEAKPYVKAALGDMSQLVWRRAHDLWSLYQQQNK